MMAHLKQMQRSISENFYIHVLESMSAIPLSKAQHSFKLYFDCGGDFQCNSKAWVLNPKSEER